MKKIILAINNKNLIEKIKNKNNKNIIFKFVQYREAILEILEKTNKINYIFIEEKLPGQISIEDLIKKIKIKNNKINIIFFLEKEDRKKENKLKKLGIKNIYLNNKINNNKLINNLLEKDIINKKNNINNLNKKQKIKNIKFKINKLKINKFNYLKNKKKEIKINKKISIFGDKKSEKNIIINLLLIYLINKNKKILLINLNKKIEKNYLIIFGKKYLKNKNKINNNFLENNKINKKENLIKNIKKSELKINKNIYFIYNLESIFYKKKKEILEEILREYKNKYDYIIIDSGTKIKNDIKKNLMENSDKNILVLNDKTLGIEEIKELYNNVYSQNKKVKDSLHIIQNQYGFNSINYSILKNIFKNNIDFSKIFYHKNFKNLAQEIRKNKKIKLNKILNNKIEKIFNN